MDDLIIIGLGSNLGDSEHNINMAIEFLQAHLLEDIVVSKTYHSPPLLPSDAPPEWNINFFNKVISGKLKDKKITSQLFLQRVKEFEKQLGRKPSARWAPRKIDIDILAWGNQIINEPNLQIPHPAMLDREFVMIPLREIAPHWKYPQK